MHVCTRELRSFNARQPIEAVAFAPDGKRFATGGWGGVARIWDTASGTELLAIPTGGQYVFAVAFSPDGDRLATGVNAQPDYLKIWDARSGALVKSLPGHRDAVLASSTRATGNACSPAPTTHGPALGPRQWTVARVPRPRVVGVVRRFLAG